MPYDRAVVACPQDADAAFRSLYAEHGSALLRLATALTGGDHGRAEDLVQETMLRAWTHLATLDIEHRPPRAWLTTIARRLAIDAHRARRSRPQETQLYEHLEPAASQPADPGGDEGEVRDAIAALPGPQRQVLTEIYYRDASVAETARALQIPPGTVRSRTFYGLRRLRTALGAHVADGQPPATTPSPAQPTAPGTRPNPRLAGWDPRAERGRPGHGC
jgi:RNA polymerase sigma-70 factor (ECF subfamily)